MRLRASLPKFADNTVCYLKLDFRQRNDSVVSLRVALRTPNVVKSRSDFDSLLETTPSSRYARYTPNVAKSRSDFVPSS